MPDAVLRVGTRAASEENLRTVVRGVVVFHIHTEMVAVRGVGDEITVCSTAESPFLSSGSVTVVDIDVGPDREFTTKDTDTLGFVAVGMNVLELDGVLASLEGSRKSQSTDGRDSGDDESRELHGGDERKRKRGVWVKRELETEEDSEETVEGSKGLYFISFPALGRNSDG
jgi:hypothetical protein